MLVNLTPHVINVMDDQGTLVKSVMPDGTVARVHVDNVHVGTADGVDFYRSAYGDVMGLPAPVDGSTFIVSMAVRQAMPFRLDLASPGALKRDDAGQPVGCVGLVLNG